METLEVGKKRLRVGIIVASVIAAILIAGSLIFITTVVHEGQQLVRFGLGSTVASSAQTDSQEGRAEAISSEGSTVLVKDQVERTTTMDEQNSSNGSAFVTGEYQHISDDTAGENTSGASTGSENTSGASTGSGYTCGENTCWVEDHVCRQHDLFSNFIGGQKELFDEHLDRRYASQSANWAKDRVQAHQQRFESHVDRGSEMLIDHLERSRRLFFG